MRDSKEIENIARQQAELWPLVAEEARRVQGEVVSVEGRFEGARPALDARVLFAGAIVQGTGTSAHLAAEDLRRNIGLRVATHLERAFTGDAREDVQAVLTAALDPFLRYAAKAREAAAQGEGR